MQDCFRKYPEVYGEEIADEEAAEAEAAAANSAAPIADAKDVPPKAAAPETPAKPAPTPETPSKSADKKPSAPLGLEQKTHDATADAPEIEAATPATGSKKPAASGDSQAFKDDLVDGQRAIPKRSFDATSANDKESK